MTTRVTRLAVRQPPPRARVTQTGTRKQLRLAGPVDTFERTATARPRPLAATGPAVANPPDARRASINPLTSLLGSIGAGLSSAVKAGAGLVGSLFQGVLGFFGIKPRGPAVPALQADSLPGHMAAVVQRARALPGWGALQPNQQERLAALLGGATNDLSTRARTRFDALVAAPGFAGRSATEQANALRGLLQSPAGNTSGINTPARTPAANTLSGPTEVKGYVFEGAVGDADVWTVNVRGQNIPVVIPRSPSGAIANEQQVAGALARLQPEELQRIQRVVVNPAANPIDAFWSAVYHQPGFRSYMTSGSTGQITIYPNTGSDPAALARAMSHECGHILSNSAWGDLPVGINWDGWNRARAEDATTVSTYGQNSPAEDFAESFNLYMRTKGTPQQDEYRTIFPDRFAYIDRLLG